MSRPQFDPSAYAAQLEDKKSRLAGLLAPFAAPAPEIFESPHEHYRLRAEFRLWRKPATRSVTTRCSSRATSTRRS